MRVDDSDIILALYRSAQERPAWAGFLAAVAARVNAKTVQVIIQPEGGPPAVYGAQTGPLTGEILARMRYLRPYSGDDFSSAMPFRALRTRVDGGDAWLVAAREGDDFSAAVSALFGLLAPHLAQGAAQFWQADALRAKEAAAQDLAARAGISWALLSAQGTVVLADRLFPARYLVGDRLRFPAPQMHKILAAIDSYRLGRSLDPMAVPDALLFPFDARGVSVHGATAILYVQTAKSRLVNGKIMGELFGLTVTEARFAAALAAGNSIAQAGAALNLTQETARYYSKQIYAKLDVSGQVEATRRIENSLYKLC